MGISRFPAPSFLAGFDQVPSESVPGYDHGDSVPLEGDSVGSDVAWKNGPLLPEALPGHSLLISIRMFMAECFAYEITTH